MTSINNSRRPKAVTMPIAVRMAASSATAWSMIFSPLAGDTRLVAQVIVQQARAGEPPGKPI